MKKRSAEVVKVHKSLEPMPTFPGLFLSLISLTFFLLIFGLSHCVGTDQFSRYRAEQSSVCLAG